MNNRYIYALMFDRDDGTDFKKLHEKLVSKPCIINWFHYIKSSYILVSDLSTANSLDREIRDILINKDYLLVAIDLKDCQGWLPERAWQWIKRQTAFI